jgi:hypothetical protein
MVPFDLFFLGKIGINFPGVETHDDFVGCNSHFTMKRAKDTKDSEIQYLKLRDLRVLRGENYPLVFRYGFAAPRSL